MTVNKKLTMGPFIEHVTCIMAFFITFIWAKLCQFYSFSSSVLFNKNNKLWNQKREGFLYIWLVQHTMLYQRMQKILSLETIAFLDTHVFMIFCAGLTQLSQIHWQALGCVFLVTCCNVIRASSEIKKERLSYRKKYIEEK